MRLRIGPRSLRIGPSGKQQPLGKARPGPNPARRAKTERRCVPPSPPLSLKWGQGGRCSLPERCGSGKATAPRGKRSCGPLPGERGERPPTGRGNPQANPPTRPRQAPMQAGQKIRPAPSAALSAGRLGGMGKRGGCPGLCRFPARFSPVVPLGCFLWFCLLLPRVFLLLGLPRCSGSGVSLLLAPGVFCGVVSVSLLSAFLLLGLAVPCLLLRLKLARLFLPLAGFRRSPVPLRPLSVPVPVCGLFGCLCPLGLALLAFGPLASACAFLTLGGAPGSRGWPFRPAFFLGKGKPPPGNQQPGQGFCQHQRC